LCVLNPLLFSLFLTQVALALVLVMTSVVVPLLTSGTFGLPLKEPLRKSTYLAKLKRRLLKRLHRLKQPRRLHVANQGHPMSTLRP
jgi:hypothetical protein